MGKPKKAHLLKTALFSICVSIFRGKESKRDR